jgi:membrane associated rhomboid family serine protease
MSAGFTDTLVLNQDSWSQPWRFLTSIFLHGSPAHLILNLFALILFGFILERVIGSKRFIFVFFISGILANLISVNFYPSSLGASGAIYGILGCLTVLRPRMTVWVYSLPMPMFLASIIWIGIGIFGILNPSQIGDIAHLSGIAAGAILGFYYYKDFKEHKQIENKVELPEDYMGAWENVYMRK